MSSHDLFLQYISIVNAAIQRNSDRFPYNLLFKAGQRFYEERPIGIAIYADQPDAPHEYFTVGFREGMFAVNEHGKADGLEVEWRIDQRHLEHVVADPERFKEEPARLDLDWLTTRLGLAGEGGRLVDTGS